MPNFINLLLIVLFDQKYRWLAVWPFVELCGISGGAVDLMEISFADLSGFIFGVFDGTSFEVVAEILFVIFHCNTCHLFSHSVYSVCNFWC